MPNCEMLVSLALARCMDPQAFFAGDCTRPVGAIHVFPCLATRNLAVVVVEATEVRNEMNDLAHS